MSSSCIYEGTVRHRRRTPRREFRYRLALAYVDLAELPTLLGGRLIDSRRGLLRFRRADYLGDPRTPLDTAIRDRVVAATGHRPEGPIRVLTQLRSFGHVFNPVSFYYCFDAVGDELEAIVAEVENTPWRERRAYVLRAGDAPGRVLKDSAEKAMHVSPLMGMDQRYRFSAALPGETLSVHIDCSEDGESVFDATLSLRRRPLDAAGARRLSIRFPLASVRVLALIYLQALRARIAGAPWYSHPGEAAA